MGREFRYDLAEVLNKDEELSTPHGALGTVWWQGKINHRNVGLTKPHHKSQHLVNPLDFLVKIAKIFT